MERKGDEKLLEIKGVKRNGKKRRGKRDKKNRRWKWNGKKGINREDEKR